MKFFVFFLSLLSFHISESGFHMKMIVKELQNLFKFQYVTIISNVNLERNEEIEKVFKSTKLQIVNENLTTFSKRKNNGYFVVGENITATKKILKNLFMKDKQIFFDGYWFVNGLSSIDNLDIRLRFDSEFYVLKEKTGPAIDLFESYELGVDTQRKIITKTLGLSKKATEKLEFDTGNKWKRRSNLMGMHFELVTVPISNKIMTPYSAASEWLGMIPDIMKSLARDLNFTYSFAPSRDGKWGGYDTRTGQWNGIVKDLLDGNADMAAASLSVTKDRSEVLDFMMPFEHENIGCFISTQTSYSWKTYLLPFLYETWAVLFVILISCSVVFAFVAKAGDDECLQEFTLKKCATYVFGAYGGVAVRRWTVTPSNLSSR